MTPSESAESVGNRRAATTAIPRRPVPRHHDLPAVKPPLHSLAGTALGRGHVREASSSEIKIPHVVASALVSAFAATVTDALGNQLLTHYYLTGQCVDVNLDRVLDGLVDRFTREAWDELWDFYYASNAEHARQLSLLFPGPVRQLIMILVGPDLARCILNTIGPGLSRRLGPPPPTSSPSGTPPPLDGTPVHLEMAVQLVFRWWHREFPADSPGGSPDDIARTICARTVSGRAFGSLIERIRSTLYTPHHVQKHLVDSSMWHILTRRPYPPPSDGFHVWQFRIECDASQRMLELEAGADLGSLPVIVGTASECYPTTVAEYTWQQWPRRGALVAGCLDDALCKAAESARRANPFVGISLWDEASVASPEDTPMTDDPATDLHSSSSGIRAIHVEIDGPLIRLTVCARPMALVDIAQQVSWTCAALSSSPFPDALCECRTNVAGWEYGGAGAGAGATTTVGCSLSHREVGIEHGSAWLQGRRGAVVVPGFPVLQERMGHFQPDMI